MSEEKAVLLPTDVFNKIVEYLSTRPYNEVAGAIEEIRNSMRVIDLPSEEEKEDE